MHRKTISILIKPVYEINNENLKLFNQMCSIDVALMCLRLFTLYIFQKHKFFLALENIFTIVKKAGFLCEFFLTLASKDKTLKVFDITCPACPLFLFKRGEHFELSF